ncbi:hypothetical protein ACLB2K_034295 [Fragaria x ananassa]
MPLLPNSDPNLGSPTATYRTKSKENAEHKGYATHVMNSGPKHICKKPIMAILEPPAPGEDLSSAESSEDEPHTEVDTVVPPHALTNTKLSDMMLFKGLINGHTIDVFVDCGSAIYFLHPAVATRLSLPRTAAEPLRFTSATGQTTKPSGLACGVTVKIQEYELTSDFLLLPVPGCDLLLGAQWLDTLGFIGWHFLEKVMMFVADGKHHVLYGIKQRPATEPSLNLMAILAQEQIDYATLGPTVPPAEAHCPQVQQLLTNFHMLFEAPTGLPPIRAIDHRIPLLPSASPVNVRPYRYPHLQKAEPEAQVNDMLSNGLIRPSQSPFSSPVLVVRKKDKAWRFCVDYRELNAVTIKDRFPIPVVDELLDEFHGARYFTKLDLHAGYHQIRMCEQDIHKTAFRTHDGHYEFVVMPFGLSNAPSTFQALMNLVFKPLLRKATEAFQQLKIAVTIATVLAMPDFSIPFTIETDASGLGIGVVLSQRKHPITYLSKSLSPRNQALSVYDKEMLAVLYAVEKWRPYLLGHQFTILTDHQTLKHLLDQRISTPSQYQWISKLLGYDQCFKRLRRSRDYGARASPRRKP